jgi:hypothetical protein
LEIFYVYDHHHLKYPSKLIKRRDFHFYLRQQITDLAKADILIFKLKKQAILTTFQLMIWIANLLKMKILQTYYMKLHSDLSQLILVSTSILFLKMFQKNKIKTIRTCHSDFYIVYIKTLFVDDKKVVIIIHYLIWGSKSQVGFWKAKFFTHNLVNLFNL